MKDRARLEGVLAHLREQKRREKHVLGELHAFQRAVVTSPLKRKIALCGRRSGKTEMDARYVALELDKCGPDEWCIYAAVTRSLAKDLIWGRLQRLNARHGFGWRMLENEARIITPRGGQFRCLGFDKAPELEKTRGYKLRLALFDEPATYVDKLEALLADCIEPALFDLNGTVLINGTPGHVCVGFWYHASTGQLQNWPQVWSWTLRENPLLPRDGTEGLESILKEKGWTVENPTFRREYLAEWFSDPSALVYAYVQDRNGVRGLPPDYDPQTWHHTIGIDFGYHPDPCTWVVLASSGHSRPIYAVHSEYGVPKSDTLGLLPDEAAAVTSRLVRKYRPHTVVGDPSAKAYLEEWNRRWAEQTRTWIRNAEKMDKVGAIDLMNGELRAQRLQICLDTAPEYAHEIQYLPWADEKRDREHSAYANHACDAALYAFREHRSYWHRPADKQHVTTDERPGLEDRQRRVRDKSGRDWDEPW